MRALAYDTLSALGDLTAIVDDRIFSAYDEVPATPFVVIRVGNSTPGLKNLTYREYFTIWAHDAPGDYSTIDQILDICRPALVGLSNQGNLFEVNWIENSQDLPLDPLTGTIGKFSRYQHASRR